MINIVIIGVGGFIGAVMRYIVGLMFLRFLPSSFPLATLFVNVCGSFVMGMFAAGYLSGFLTPRAMLLLATGFLGAFTTFSAFSIETVHLYNNQKYGMCVLNVLLLPLLSILSAYIGLKLFV